MSRRLVIVGAGQVAAQLIAALQLKKPAGLHPCLVGCEAHLPYQRPPLSKAFLTGDLAEDRLQFRAPGYYADAGVELHLGRRAEKLDRARSVLQLDDGTELAYDALVLATGARPRPVDIPGIGLRGVQVLRSLDDARSLRSALRAEAPRRLVVIGGGYIGLEIAASARKLGAQVTVLEAAARVLSRVASPLIADELTAWHHLHGVEIRTGVQVSSIEGDTDVSAVRCRDGSVLPADLVVVGVGVLPNDELAVQAGLDSENGIAVDAHCRTADPAIWAAGDCASVHHERLGCRVRLESVPHAIEQANAIAAQLCGEPVPAPGVPWFWSDQHGVKLQMAGLSAGHDFSVVRRYPGPAPTLTEFYFSAGRLIAATALNRPQDFMAAKRLLLEAPLALLDPEQLADPAVSLAAIATATPSDHRITT